MNKESHYQKLTESLKYISHFNNILNLLDWDEQVNLPPKGAQQRATQKSQLAALIHKEFTKPQIGESLMRLEDNLKFLSRQEATVVRETRREYNKATQLPVSFVERKAQATSESYHAWIDARNSNNFDDFAPHLEKVLNLTKEEANILGFKDNPYDYCIDEHDPGLNAQFIDDIFYQLKNDLIPIVGKIKASSVKPDISRLKNFSIPQQKAFCQQVIKALGFDT